MKWKACLKISIFFSLLAPAIAASSMGLPAPPAEWRREEPVQSKSCEDTLPAALGHLGNAAVIDKDGCLYVALREDTPDYSLAKYDENRCLCWLKRYDGPAKGDDFAKAVAVDGEGNVYVTGASQGRGGDFDYATLKYGPQGDLLWVSRYGGPTGENDLAAAIAVDGSGNVYVTGTSPGYLSKLDYVTVKYDRHGRQLWARRYNGPGNDIDWGKAILIDKDGCIAVTGLSLSSDGSEQYATVKYDRFGEEIQVKRFAVAEGAD